MIKEINYICAQPDDTYFTWQVHLWLENLRNLHLSEKAVVLIFIPSFRTYNEKWDKIIDLYPEATFKVYKDEDNVSRLLSTYIPILRPYSLWRYWKEFPDMKDRAVLYYDCDVLLTDKFDISKYIHDDVCYVSDTNSYINASYFDSKVKDVKPDMLYEYKRIDVLANTTAIAGVTRAIAEKNNMHSGGAQYLLKNITVDFWDRMMKDVIGIRTYLQMDINRKYFESESKGYQSWCADMWALLWGLWRTEHEVRVIPEMNFSWATDPIERLSTHPMFHNAGVVSKFMDNVPFFYKGEYHAGGNPFTDNHLNIVLNNEESKKKCTWYYANELFKLNQKYNVDHL